MKKTSKTKLFYHYRLTDSLKIVIKHTDCSYGQFSLTLVYVHTTTA